MIGVNISVPATFLQVSALLPGWHDTPTGLPAQQHPGGPSAGRTSNFSRAEIVFPTGLLSADDVVTL